MKTLHRHLFADFMVYVLTATAALVFVVCVALVFGTADLMVRGVGAAAFLKVVALGIPTILPFALPVSLLTASLLLFGRLSSDGEITAMKAGGMSLWRVVSPLLLFALLTSLVCVWINNRTVPRNRYAQRRLLEELSAVAPLDFFPAGQTISEFPGLTVWVERIEDDELVNLRIYDRRQGQTQRDIHARRGTVSLTDDGHGLMLDLFDVTIDPFDENRPGPALVGRWPLRLGDVRQRRSYRERPGDFELDELRSRIRTLQESGSLSDEAERDREIMALRVEINKRFALSAACFAFVLLGIPLGIKAHRRESSIGGAISLAVLLVFYVVLVLVESLRRHPQFRPDILIWTPVLISLFFGWRLVRRAEG